MRVEHHSGGIYDLHDVSSAALAVRSAKKLIDKCYSKMAYEHSDRSLVQDYVKLDEIDNSYSISFYLDGVSEIAIAFRSNGEGEITKTFEYSTL